MEHCEACENFDEVSGLLRKLSLGGKLSGKESEKIKELIRHRRSAECSCANGHCPYTKAIDWVEYEGYKHLDELIGFLDIDDKILKIKPRKSFDSFRATWARLPGSYGG